MKVKVWLILLHREGPRLLLMDIMLVRGCWKQPDVDFKVSLQQSHL